MKETATVSALLKRLTLQEKAELVSGKNFWFTQAIDRVDLPAIMMTDGPSGLRKQADSADALGLNRSVQAVNFPASALTASSFNRPLLKRLGQHLGRAAKANQVSVLLGPGINIKRSPLAGRNFEYFSEDPLVAGNLGAAYVQGVQSEGVGVSVKHFAANNRENQRFTVSSNIDERTLREIYLAAFETIVKTAQPATLMCSYNALNHSLNSQNHRLLTDILRDEWDFQGLVMSDWGAVADHAAALKAGLDLEMPGKGQASIDEVLTALKTGRLTEAQLDHSVRRVLTMILRYRLAGDTTADYDLDEQHQFARQAAANSMILLKNEAAMLPLQTDEQIGIVGELAAKPRYQGGGSSHVNAYRVTSPLEVAKSIDIESGYAQGYSLATDDVDADLVADALDLAKSVDKVVFFAGVPEQDESEGYDKTTIALPANQTTLIEQVARVNPNIVVVLQNGSAVTMPWLSQVNGVVETYLAGEAVGEATWDVLTGAVNPNGHLAETFPLRVEDTPTYGTFNANRQDENYREGIFVGYRYYDTKRLPVLFPFGYGLSYTTFDYQDLTVSETADQQVSVTFTVTNTGDRAGQATPQIYVANQASQIEKPAKELRDFAKVMLQPGESQTITLTLFQRAFSWYNPQAEAWQSDAGTYEIMVGTSVEDVVLHATLALHWGVDAAEPVTADTYFSDILRRKDLTTALEASGLDKLLATLGESSENAQLLENIPLRSAVMLGANNEQVATFIQLANR